MRYPSYIDSNSGFYYQIVNDFYSETSAAHTKEEYESAISSICRRYRREFTDQDVMAYMVNELGFEDKDTVERWYVENAGEIQKAFLKANLKAGNRYTLVYYSEFGFPVSIQITLSDVHICGYAQYDDAVLLYFKKKGCRKLSGKYFYGIKKVAVYEGWKELPENFGFDTLRKNDVCTVKTSKYTCFDDRYFTDIVNVLGTPILKIA